MGGTSEMTSVERVFLECERARAEGELIAKVSASDKEYHFQNWVQARVDACGLRYHKPKRNSYPDFKLRDSSDGFEVKGLAWPGREANYDSNSQLPVDSHEGWKIFYVFGRYPADTIGLDQYPVTDLVVCPGSFLNPDSNYVHANKSFPGFGLYGDIRVRDRKMYVVPTPYALADGTAGRATLIVPATFRPVSEDLVRVGELERVEVEQNVASYRFDLDTNNLVLSLAPNSTAGRAHRFHAYRSRRFGDLAEVTLSSQATRTRHAR